MRTQRRLSVSDFRYTPLIAALGLALAPAPVSAATVTVTNQNDNVDTPGGSLRDAIEHFNTTDILGNLVNCTGSDVINFDFPNGPFVVSLAADLPPIACGGLTIDGSHIGSRDASHPLDPPSAGIHIGLTTSDPITAAQIGLETAGSIGAVTVTHLEVFGFTYGTGTGLLGKFVSNGNDLHDNVIGFDNAGFVGTSIVDSTVSSNATGIYVSYGGGVASALMADVTHNSVNNNTLQGIYLEHALATVSGNTIDYNGTGIYIEEDQGSQISGNFIGTISGGSEPAGNSIGVAFGSPLGGTSINTALTANTISGNNDVGIDLSHFQDIHINGNWIGTNSSDGGGLGNQSSGVVAHCGIGLELTGNVISGNATDSSDAAVDLRGVQSGGTVVPITIVSGNKIGVASNGTTPLGNNAYGVFMGQASCGLGEVPPIPTTDILVQDNDIGSNGGVGVSMVNASNNTLETNRIFSNSSYGIEIVTGVDNAMVGNLVYGNAGSLLPADQKNINLGFSGGPLPNDTGDVDSGIPNDGQNYPVIDPLTGVVPDVANNRTIVSFTLDTEPGDYRVDLYSNASATIVPGGDRIVATISPFHVASGPVSGSVTVPGLTTDNFSMLATSLPASGVGETSEFSPVVGFVPAPNVGISPSSSMDFGDVSINTDSPAKSVSIASTGTLPYHLYSIGDSECSGGAICASGAFTCTTTCTNNTDYAPASACQVTATFHPTVLGPFSHTIQICDNVEPDSRTITLSGNGVVPPPIVISPSSWDFGSALLGIHSPSTSFTIFNPGGVPVSIGVPATSPDFVIESTDCGSTIPAKDRCHANVSFVPSRPGAITGTFSVTAGTIPASASASKRAGLAKSASGPAATAALSGTGVIQAILDLPSAIDFGDYTSGSAPLRRIVTLRNNGNAVLTLSTVSVTGPFTLGNGCSENLLPTESCTLTLDFSSAALGPYSGTLVVVSNAVGGSRTIPLSARTVSVPAPRIRVSPASIGFGDRLLGTVSGSQRVTITNDGNDAAVLSAPVTTSLDFLVVGTTCGVSLAPAQTCFADVALRPVSFGPRAGQLLINSNAAGSPSRVDLLGTGCRPFVSTASRMGASFGCSP